MGWDWQDRDELDSIAHGIGELNEKIKLLIEVLEEINSSQNSNRGSQ